MPRIIGEAKFDARRGKWYFVMYEENGEVLFESPRLFDSQREAEEWLMRALKGMAEEFPPEPDDAPASSPRSPRP